MNEAECKEAGLLRHVVIKSCRCSERDSADGMVLDFNYRTFVLINGIDVTDRVASVEVARLGESEQIPRVRIEFYPESLEIDLTEPVDAVAEDKARADIACSAEETE